MSAEKKYAAPLNPKARLGPKLCTSTPASSAPNTRATTKPASSNALAPASVFLVTIAGSAEARAG